MLVDAVSQHFCVSDCESSRQKKKKLCKETDKRPQTQVSTDVWSHSSFMNLTSGRKEAV